MAIRKELREQFDLVFAGPIGWASGATIATLNQGRNGIRYLGYVDEADLAGLTAGAAALAYPSLYEGFGSPVAQAMAAVLRSDLERFVVAGSRRRWRRLRRPSQHRKHPGSAGESAGLTRSAGRVGKTRKKKGRELPLGGRGGTDVGVLEGAGIILILFVVHSCAFVAKCFKVFRT